MRRDSFRDAKPGSQKLTTHFLGRDCVREIVDEANDVECEPLRSRLEFFCSLIHRTGTRTTRADAAIT